MNDPGTKLKALVKQLRWRDWRRRGFACKWHRYRFGKTISESAVSRFEKANKIQLPESYRDYLINLGNGGAGPCYGVDAIDPGSIDQSLRKPFPLTFQQASELTAEASYDLEGTECGVLCLCHYGCANYYFLVVNGPAFGSVLLIGDVWQAVATDFYDWMIDWAKLRIVRCKNRHFFRRLRKGMSIKDVELMTGCTWKTRQVGDRRLCDSVDGQVPVQLVVSAAGTVLSRKRHPYD